MQNIDELFRRRIHYSLSKKLGFKDLDDILDNTAQTFPFENLCIMKGKHDPITKESLIEKTLERNNKSPLITKLNEKGSMTLTNHSFTKWEDGRMLKEDISDEKKFKELAKSFFGLEY